jgi:o-succinylbenzoate---CoA ligase
VVGRRDALIISGGEKVDPAEVETALRESGFFTDVAVLGLPDPQWGQIVVACYPAGGFSGEVMPWLPYLAAYKRPKRYVAVANWPRNEQGKVSRAVLRERVLAGG